MVYHETDADSIRHRIHWPYVFLLAGCAVLGVLGPKILWMSETYSNTVRSWSYDLQYLIHPSMRMVLVVMVWSLLRLKKAGDTQIYMGLWVGWKRGVLASVCGVLCTIPMWGLGLFAETNSITRFDVMYKAFSPGVTEEIFYRALLFGMLVQLAKVNIWPAAIITGIIFGLAHIDLTPEEGKTIIEQFNLWNAIIGLGGTMYAWIYAHSSWNLWCVIWIHISMNLCWHVFDLTSTPLGGWGATAVRIVSVGLAVYFVIFMRILEPKNHNEQSTISA